MYELLTSRRCIVALFFMTSTSLLTGCGFHLRTVAIHSSELKTLNIHSKERDLTYMLKSTLQNAGINISFNAPYRIEIIDFSILSDNKIQATNNIANYTLHGTVKWELQNASGQPLFLTRKLSKSISYQIVRNINVSSTAENTAIENLKREIVLSIVRQISAITADQLTTWQHEMDIKQTQQKMISDSSKKYLRIDHKNDTGS